MGAFWGAFGSLVGAFWEPFGKPIGPNLGGWARWIPGKIAEGSHPFDFFHFLVLKVTKR